jgi:SAM-dependent methyltransferase
MVALAVLASFLAAALLFAVQPMAAKMALPLLGGSASVWTVCMLFFQTGLLAGYGWAHVLSRFAVRNQVMVHASLVAAAVLTLPPAIAAASLPPVDASPAPWLLTALALSFGLPYAALSASGPLLQRWFSSTSHTAAADPYFLYAASNAGSFAGLLAYPFFFERSLPLRAVAGFASQAGVWSVGFCALAIVLVASGIWAARRPAAPTAVDASRAAGTDGSSRLRWAALAFVPSSVVLGATQYMTSNIAAIPLFWIVPLALYLLTFVIAFSPRVKLSIPWAGVVVGLSLLVAAAEFREGARLFGRVSFAIHLCVLVSVGLLCHGRLAADRPHRSRLTEYYLWIALGGCLGGVFNALVAPLIFDSIAEYPLALALAAFLVPDPARDTPTSETRLARWALDAAAALAVACAILVVSRLVPTTASGTRWLVVVAIGVPSLLTLALIGWPRRFALAVATLLAFTWTSARSPWSALHRERTFYGVHRIIETTGLGLPVTGPDGHPGIVAQKLHVLINGSTRHGSQSLDPERRLIPTTYFHPSGPLGDIVRGMRARGPILEIGVIGLGAGTTAAYGEPGSHVTYFEIDPAVARLAWDPAFFTYLTDSRAEISVVLGDGRRRIAECADGRFDLIILDAFSSDAIPVHLLTREAVSLYLRKLKPGGCLAFHLTNGYLALDPVVAAIAADLGIPAAIKYDLTRTPEQAFEGKDFSKWALMTRNATSALPALEGWSRMPSDPGPDATSFLWTDDRSNLVELLVHARPR